MSEELQGLLEKINREGVEKAQVRSGEIIAAAEAEARRLVAAAQKEAAQRRAEAEKAAADYAARAEVTVRQAARDTVREVERAVTGLLENLLAKDVDAALARPERVAELVTGVLKDMAGPAEVALPPALAQTLRAQLAAEKNLTIVPDESVRTGFSVKIDGGRVEHAFTGPVVAAELARRLRPDLAKLVRAQ